MIPYRKERHESSGGSNLKLEKIIIDHDTRSEYVKTKQINNGFEDKPDLRAN